MPWYRQVLIIYISSERANFLLFLSVFVREIPAIDENRLNIASEADMMLLRPFVVSATCGQKIGKADDERRYPSAAVAFLKAFVKDSASFSLFIQKPTGSRKVQKQGVVMQRPFITAEPAAIAYIIPFLHLNSSFMRLWDFFSRSGSTLTAEIAISPLEITCQSESSKPERILRPASGVFSS